jgi:uncharacterized membrane protein YraQ (UPF0718 family)
VVPTSVTLRKNGASNAATSSFLIATPESGVDSIAMTYAMMDFPMTIIRPIAAFVSAFIAGVLNIFFNDYKVPEELKNEEKKSCCGSKAKVKMIGESLKDGMSYAFGKLINDLSLWMTIGILLGALISYLVPNDFFIGLSETQSLLMILLIGVPLYICASATTPIAASLIMKGLNPGAALVLLLVGPATNVSNMAVIQKYIGRKGVMLNVFAIVFVAVTFGEIVNYLYYSVFKVDPKTVMKIHAHHHGSEELTWLAITAAVLICILLIKGIYLEEIKPRLSKKDSHCH